MFLLISEIVWNKVPFTFNKPPKRGYYDKHKTVPASCLHYKISFLWKRLYMQLEIIIIYEGWGLGMEQFFITEWQ